MSLFGQAIFGKSRFGGEKIITSGNIFIPNKRLLSFFKSSIEKNLEKQFLHRLFRKAGIELAFEKKKLKRKFME